VISYKAEKKSIPDFPVGGTSPPSLSQKVLSSLGGVAQVVETLPSKHEVLSSNASMAKNQTKKCALLPELHH
jgi:hypothetical protein